jgi:hypothetical protein
MESYSEIDVPRLMQVKRRRDVPRAAGRRLPGRGLLLGLPLAGELLRFG